MHTFYIFPDGPVHRLAVPDVSDIDDNFDQMFHAPAALFDKLADILHHLVGLRGRVMAVNIPAVFKVLWTLAAHIYRFTARGHHCLAQIIVKVLFAIGVFGVELANTPVNHRLLLLLRFGFGHAGEPGR